MIEHQPEPKRNRRPTSTYVLQVPAVDGTDRTLWEDAATVTVPASTRRISAVRKALEAWGGEIPVDGLKVRLIAGEDATTIPVKPKPPEAPQLEIG